MIKNKSVVLLTVIACISFSVIYITKDKASSTDSSSEFLTSVETNTISLSSIETYKKYSGNISGIKEEIISPQIPSEVKEIRVKKGDYVKKGQVLMVLDSSSVDEQVSQAKNAYDKANQGVEQAKAQQGEIKKQLTSVNSELDSSKKNLSDVTSSIESLTKELEELNNQKESGEISMQDFLLKAQEINASIKELSDKATTLQKPLMELEMKKATLEKTLESMGGSNLDSQIGQVKEMYDKALETKEGFILKAPFNGYVTSLNAKVGEIPMGLNPPIVVSDTSSLKMEITLSEIDAKKVKVGSKYKVSLESIDGNKVDVNSTITSIEKIPSSDFNEYKATLNVPNKNDFKSGSFGELYIPTSIKNDVVVISKNALIRENDESFVYIIGKDNKAKKVKVTLSVENDEFIEVTNGLNVDDILVTKGKDFIKENESINIVRGDK